MNKINNLNSIRLPAVRANMPVRESDIREIQEVTNILERIYSVDLTIFPIVKAGDPITTVLFNRIFSAVNNLDKMVGIEENWKNYPVSSGDDITEDLFNELIGSINRIILNTQNNNVDAKNYLLIRSLKEKLSGDQINILNVSCEYFIDRGKCIPSRGLFIKINKPKAKEIVESIGGAYIFETTEKGKKCYQLTFLGLMLTEYYAEIEYLLVKYLEFVKDKFITDPDCEYFDNSELDVKLGLTKERSEILRRVIHLAHLFHGSMSYSGTGTWTSSYPEDVEELRFVDDIRDYIIQHALKYARLDDPVSQIERTQALFVNHSENNLFDSLEGNSQISSEAPELIKNMVWIRKNWKKYWLYLLILFLIISVNFFI